MSRQALQMAGKTVEQPHGGCGADGNHGHHPVRIVHRAHGGSDECHAVVPIVLPPRGNCGGKLLAGETHTRRRLVARVAAAKLAPTVSMVPAR